MKFKKFEADIHNADKIYFASQNLKIISTTMQHIVVAL